MKSFRSIVGFSALLGLLISLSAVGALAQTITGTISGTVKDSSGAAMAAAKVEVLNQDTGVARAIDADAAGHYSALLLPLGNYKVTATHEGFQTQVRSGIELTLGREAVVDLTLAVGATTQSVEVKGEAALINTTSSQIQGLVEGDQIRELPLNGRSYNDLALLSPGVIYNKMTGSSSTDGFGVRMSVNGARTNNNLFLIDGTMINDTSQTAGTVNADSLGVEGIREFTVLTHNYTAEFGTRAGGVVNAVTRSGTNQLHGSLYEFLRNSDLDARDFFQPGDVAPFRRNQFGGSIGGRIIKDKLFFFGNYEGFRQSLTIAQLGNVPNAQTRLGFLPCTAAPDVACAATGLANVGVSPLVAKYMALYAQPNNNHDNGDGSAQWAFPFKQPIIENYYMERVDFHISDKDNFYARYIYDPSTRLRASGDPYWSSQDAATNYFAQIGETHIFSPTAINDLRVAFNRTDRHTDIGPVNSAISSLITPDLSFVPGMPIGRWGYTNSASGAASAAGGLETLGNLDASPTVYLQNLFEEGDTFNLVRGKHSFKFGADLQRIQTQNVGGGGVRGSWQFGSIEGFLKGQPLNQDAGKVLGLTSLGTISVQEFGWRHWLPSWFVADDWRVTSRLTLNLGIRQEFFTDLTEVNGLMADLVNITDAASAVGVPYHTSKRNFAPRFGFAWDPTGTGKTSIRGGIGTFFNEVNAKEAGPPKDYRFAATYTAVCNWTGAANPCANFPQVPANPPLSTAKGEGAVQYNLQTPTVTQYGLEIQHQLSSTTVLRVGYVGWHGYNMTRSSDVNDKLIDPATGLYNTAGALKPNPGFGTITFLTSDGVANYNGLQAEFKKTLGSGLSFQASYTFSKTLTDADSTSNRVTDNIGNGYVSLNPLYPMVDYGPSVYSQKQTFVFNSLYNLPFANKLQNRTAKAIAGGWALNGIWQYGSGIPLNINSGYNVSGNGDPTQPDRPLTASGFTNNPINGTSAGCPGVVGYAQQTPNQWFNPCAFALPPAGTLSYPGTIGRGTVTGPGTNQINIGLSRTFSVKERMKLQFRAEAFNLVNHPQFGVPSLLVFNSNRTYSATAGQISQSQGGVAGLGGRNIQFGMKLTF